MNKNLKSMNIVLSDIAQPLARYPHVRKVGSFVFLSGISSRLPDGLVMGVRLMVITLKFVCKGNEGSIELQTRGIFQK